MADMPPPTVPPNLPALVSAAFAKARDAGDLTYYPTQVALLPLRSASVVFQLRFSPALASKPKPKPPASPPSSNHHHEGGEEQEEKKKPFNPFADPPPALRVCALPPAHVVVLNKFAVVPEHFIVATAAPEPQTHLLGARDLAAARACVRAYAQAEQVPVKEDDDKPARGGGGGGRGSGRRRLFAFYNSGPHSGASQAHRHLQLLPVDRMREGLADADQEEGEEEAGAEEAPRLRRSSWSVLADRLVLRPDDGAEDDSDDNSTSAGAGAAGDAAVPALPFAVFAAAIQPDMTADALHRTYLALYRRAVRAVRASSSSSGCSGGGGGDDNNNNNNNNNNNEDDADEVPATGEAKISYNLAMTDTSMALCPRTAEGAPVGGGDGDGEEEQDGDGGGGGSGFVALNGTVLAGTALVKSRAEWDALRTDPDALLGVLGRIGVPPPPPPPPPQEGSVTNGRL
ncbi:ATP adenylyltransferase-domain-containing protein [Xylariaceae sp. FL0804]|nr:ATP adenylyltransferase-domain-containing protein [Xylariaceae sp. FL0804]